MQIRAKKLSNQNTEPETTIKHQKRNKKKRKKKTFISPVISQFFTPCNPDLEPMPVSFHVNNYA
jgi:hypothetical protein